MTQQVQDLDLQERVRNSSDVMFRAVSGGHERLEVLYKKRYRLHGGRLSATNSDVRRRLNEPF